jgi:hypothetical protein
MICLHVSFVDRHIIGRPPFHIRVLCYQIRLTDYKLVHMTYNFVTEDLRYLPHKDLIWHRAIAICSQPRSKVLPATNLKMIWDGNDYGRMANNTVQGLVSTAIRNRP